MMVLVVIIVRRYLVEDKDSHKILYLYTSF